MNEKIEQTKSELSAALTKLDTLARESGLASIAETLSPAKKSLEKDDYNVVVCGEVKQGKTSFINALLGQKLLPTAVKIATSQVFRISNAEQESYYLVFDNGHKEAISREEMVRYGTETGEDLASDPLVRGRSLCWIEVNVPASFLPKNVHLLDTPGLGALYQNHALITHKYVAFADAVIFVKEAKDPIVDQEREFLKKVFAITPNVLFVHSKCDLYDEEAQITLAKRCEEILDKEFLTKTNTKAHLWPVSSQNLFDAAQEQDAEVRDALEEVSGFKNMLKALGTLLFRATGYSSAASAYVAAFKGYQGIVASMSEQKKLLSSTDANEKQRLQKEKAQKHQEFMRAWGPNGTELRAVNERVGQIITTAHNRLQGIFSAGGEVRQHFLKEIERLPENNKAIEEYSKLLPNAITESVCNQWRRIAEDTQKYLCEELRKYSMEMSTTCTEIQLEQANDATLCNASKYAHTRNIFMGGSMGFALANLSGYLFPATALSGPIGFAIAGGILGCGILVGAVLGKREADTTQAKSNKNLLNNYVGNTLAQMQTKLCIEPQASGKSRLQEYCDALKKQVQGVLQTLAEREQAHFEEELRFMDDALSKNVEETKFSLAKLELQTEKLRDVKEKLTTVYDALKAMEQIL